MANTAVKPKTEPRTLVAFVARMLQVRVFFDSRSCSLRDHASLQQHPVSPVLTVFTLPLQRSLFPADRLLCGLFGSCSQLVKDMGPFQVQELAGVHHVAVCQPGYLLWCDWILHLNLLPAGTTPGACCR